MGWWRCGPWSGKGGNKRSDGGSDKITNSIDDTVEERGRFVASTKGTEWFSWFFCSTRKGFESKLEIGRPQITTGSLVVFRSSWFTTTQTSRFEPSIFNGWSLEVGPILFRSIGGLTSGQFQRICGYGVIVSTIASQRLLLVSSSA